MKMISNALFFNVFTSRILDLNEKEGVRKKFIGIFL